MCEMGKAGELGRVRILITKSLLSALTWSLRKAFLLHGSHCTRERDSARRAKEPVLTRSFSPKDLQPLLLLYTHYPTCHSPGTKHTTFTRSQIITKANRKQRAILTAGPNHFLTSNCLLNFCIWMPKKHL